MARHDFGNRSTPYTQGVVTNPNGSSNFAVDTGALAAGLYEALLIFGGTVATAWTVQRRNAANGATVSSFTVYSPADASIQIAWDIELEASERVRVLPSNETGDVSAVLVLQRLT